MKHANKHRISRNALLKKGMAPEVVEAILAVQARYSHHDGKPYFGSFTLENKPAGYKYIHGEGEDLTYVYGDNTMSFRMVSNDTLGSGGMRHEIGAESPGLPAGTTIIVVWHLSGYGMSVINVGMPALTAA